MSVTSIGFYPLVQMRLQSLSHQKKITSITTIILLVELGVNPVMNKFHH